jgi:hypothetical protein
MNHKKYTLEAQHIHFSSCYFLRFGHSQAIRFYVTMPLMKGMGLQMPDNPATMHKTKNKQLKYYYHN